jgi:transposase
LFAGHDQAVENWACIASLIEPCKLCGVEPQAYLTDVLTKLVNLWSASRLDELMPWAWATEHATRPIQRLLRRLDDLGWGELRLEVG